MSLTAGASLLEGLASFLTTAGLAGAVVGAGASAAKADNANTDATIANSCFMIVPLVLNKDQLIALTVSV